MEYVHKDFRYRSKVITPYSVFMALINLFLSKGGFMGCAPAPHPPPPFFKTFLYDPNPSNRPKNRFIKCSLILSSERLTLLYCAFRKRPQCCMLYLLKSEVFIRREGRGTPLLRDYFGNLTSEFLTIMTSDKLGAKQREYLHSL